MQDLALSLPSAGTERLDSSPLAHPEEIASQAPLDPTWVADTLESGWRFDQWSNRYPDSIFREPKAHYHREENFFATNAGEVLPLDPAWAASYSSPTLEQLQGWFCEIQAAYRVEGPELVFFLMNRQSVLWRSPSGKPISSVEVVRAPLWLSSGLGIDKNTAAAFCAAGLLLLVASGEEVDIFTLDINRNESSGPQIFISPTPLKARAEEKVKFTHIASCVQTRRIFLGDSVGGLWDLTMRSPAEGNN